MDQPKAAADRGHDLMHRRLAFSILQYLSGVAQAATSGGSGSTPTGLDAEGLEVAVQCISSAFGIDLTKPEHAGQYGVPFHLTDIYNTGLLQLAQQQAPVPAEAEAPKPTASQEVPQELEVKFQNFLGVLGVKGFFNGVTKGTTEYEERFNLAKQRFLAQYAAPAAPAVDSTLEAERLKALGNEKLSAGQPAEAIQFYTQAIALNPKNAIYYGNRAAAHTALQKHDLAIQDCEEAIKLDPKYVKAYSRLGFSLFSIGKYQQAIDRGYKKVLEIDPSNAAAQESIRLCEGKGQPASEDDLQSMLRQAAGGAGGGSPPDLASLLNNPQLMNMATQMMSSPQMAQIFNNPQFMNMAQNLMQNPSQLNQMFAQMGQHPSGENEEEEKP